MKSSSVIDTASTSGKYVTPKPTRESEVRYTKCLPNRRKRAKAKR